MMKQLVCISSCCLLTFVFLAEFFYIKATYFVQLLLLVFSLMIFIFIRPLKVGVCDICIILLGAYGLFLPSVNTINTNVMLVYLITNIFAYFILRYVFTYYGKFAGYLLSIFTVCIFVLLTISFYIYYLFSETVHNAGSSSLYDFRFLYAPLGISNNVWSSLQWLFGGILAIAYFYVENRKVKALAAITGCMVLCQLLLSFSRGIYLSALVFAIVLFILERKRLFVDREKFLLGSCAIFIIGIFFLFPHETKKVFEINKTVSQQRSIDGRVKAMSITSDILKKYPWGVGLNNYTLAKDYYQVGDKRVDSYTTYAPNTISKLFIEYGYCGVCIYLILCWSIVFLLIKRKERKLWIISLFLMAFFVREQTFSTMFDSKVIQLSTLFLVAFLQSKRVECEREKKNFPVILCFLPCIVMTYVVGLVLYNRNSKECFSFMVNRAIFLRDKNVERSLCYFEKALKKSPLDIHLSFYVRLYSIKEAENTFLKELEKWISVYPDKLIFKWELYKIYRQKGFVDKAIEMFVSVVLQEPNILKTTYWEKLRFYDKEFTERVVNFLLIHISQKPSNPIDLAKYGSIAMQLGDFETAEFYLFSSNEQLPNLSRVWFNLACIYERKGLVDKAYQYNRMGRVTAQGIFTGNDYKPAEEKNIEDLIWKQYRFLFEVWYKKSLAI